MSSLQPISIHKPTNVELTSTKPESGDFSATERDAMGGAGHATIAKTNPAFASSHETREGPKCLQYLQNSAADLRERAKNFSDMEKDKKTALLEEACAGSSLQQGSASGEKVCFIMVGASGPSANALALQEKLAKTEGANNIALISTDGHIAAQKKKWKEEGRTYEWPELRDSVIGKDGLNDKARKTAAEMGRSTVILDDLHKEKEFIKAAAAPFTEAGYNIVLVFFDGKPRSNSPGDRERYEKEAQKARFDAESLKFGKSGPYFLDLRARKDVG